jgi:acyl carrier protein
MKKLTDEIIKIIAKELDVSPGSIKEDTSIQNDLGADSLDVINIVMTVENKFNIEIDEDTLHQFNTVANIAGALTMVMNQEKN